MRSTNKLKTSQELEMAHRFSFTAFSIILFVFTFAPESALCKTLKRDGKHSRRRALLLCDPSILSRFLFGISQWKHWMRSRPPSVGEWCIPGSEMIPVAMLFFPLGPALPVPLKEITESSLNCMPTLNPIFQFFVSFLLIVAILSSS